MGSLCARPPRSVWSRSTVAVIALGLGACAATACLTRREGPSEPPGESTADKHYDVAVGSFHNGMYEDAKMQLERALTVDPRHADSHYLRGVLFLNEGRNIVDAVELQQCLTDRASDQQRQRAELLHRQAAESFGNAVEFFEEGAAGRGRALNSMSVVALFFHETERAIEHARAALAEQFYTDRYSALSNLGWALHNQGDSISATAELRQAVLINPEYCVGRYRLAHVYLDAGLVEQALEEAEAVIDNASCPIQDAYRIAGVARMRLGRAADAQEAFASCVELAPRSCLAADCRQLLGPRERGGATLVGTAEAVRQ
jgi:type IV pilus assembly protein PilF